MKTIEKIPSHLRLMSEVGVLTLAATNGTRTIAQASNVFVFTGGVSPNFKEWNQDVESEEPTEAVDVQIYEVIEDGDLKKIYGGLCDNLDALYFTQDQIIQFCCDNQKLIHTDGYGGIFFLFKVKREFVVARVCARVDGVGVYFIPFSSDHVWRPADIHSRLVLP